jgi:hypothetical protein
LAVYGRKIDDFMKSAKDVGIGGQFKVELGSGAITFKAENWSTDEDNFGFYFGVDVEGKVGIKTSDLLNPKDNTLVKTFKIVKDFIKNNFSTDAIKKNIKFKGEAYIFSNQKNIRATGFRFPTIKTESEIKATVPINVGINVFGSSNNQGFSKFGIGTIDKPNIEINTKAKIGFSVTSKPIWFE